jgi:adenine-specific DNA-methyltransferase
MGASLDGHRLQAETEVKSHDISHRKKIGAFYTPLTVSTALSLWGIRTPADTVLEPCFGGCTFLEAAVDRLRVLGNPAPEQNLYGCDIDPLAFVYLRKRVEQAAIRGHFFEQDFIKFAPNQLPQGAVDLVIGNPPYIRHSNFSNLQREYLDNWAKKQGIKLHGRANLWAYFVLHAIRFLKNDGRLALVLPGSFLYAGYSESVRAYLLKSFKTVTAVSLAERLFVSEGTEETTVILLGSGFGSPSHGGRVRVTCVDSVADFSDFMASPDRHATLPDQPYAGHGMVPIDVGALHFELASTAGMRDLGTIATVRIGLVTGDAPYFIKSKREWRKHNIDARHLRYILPKSLFVKGIALDFESKEKHITDDVACLSLDTPQLPRAEHLVKYLKSYSAEKRKKNVTFKKRSIWHQFDDGCRIPDAFFVFMTDQGPRIILNDVGAIATNSVYRVFFNDDISASQMKLAAISMYTTFTQLGAEIVGHPRGAGALKLEPSSASKLMLFLPSDRSTQEIETTFNLVNEKLHAMDWDGATQAADSFLFSNAKLSRALPVLRKGLATVRQRRFR